MYWLYFTTEPVIHTRPYRGPGFPGSKGIIRDNATRCRLDGKFFNAGRALPALLARRVHYNILPGFAAPRSPVKIAVETQQFSVEFFVCFLGLFQVKRYKKSVKIFELIVIYLILLQFYPQGTGVVTGAIAV
jgi:hypothetical protein